MEVRCVDAGCGRADAVRELSRVGSKSMKINETFFDLVYLPFSCRQLSAASAVRPRRPATAYTPGAELRRMFRRGAPFLKIKRATGGPIKKQWYPILVLKTGLGPIVAQPIP